MTDPAIRRALLSVSDKTGLAAFAKRLAVCGVELISTGGTAKALRAAGLTVTDVSDVTRFPEMLDGRVKTLHPAVHGGLLAIGDNPSHAADLERSGIEPIDLIAINLYPFEETRARGAGFDESVENIDIGGPAMIRAAAKNHAFVTVLTDPSDYDAAAEAIEASGSVPASSRRALAAKAFRRTAAYDAAVSGWLTQETGEDWPERLTFAGALGASLRYGENPHQRAALYLGGAAQPGPATAEQIQGKPLSFNNLNDADAAFALASELGADAPAVVIVKHANPCGVAAASTLAQAYDKALRCDPVSAFGGIIAVNRTLDVDTASQIASLFDEVVIEPGADEPAREILARKTNLRVLLTGAMADPSAESLDVRTLAGGLLVQSRDTGRAQPDELKVVTKRAPTAEERRDLLFAFQVGKHVKSNAIVYVKDQATVGVGAGQMSRVDSARIAARKAADAAAAAGETEPLTAGSVVASDAFFPFADGLLAAAEAGATAVIQPGGSMRDEEVIAAADAAGLAMVFTGLRHFRH
ncbi:MAG: bifunctional phosphoribosylaminoimidazolecarboxamide formyltransferase/IMP cyclohydrolase [Pseudomonadota bacterium]